MIFDLENWLWTSNFGTFWHLPITPIHKFQWFHLNSWFLGQNLSTFASLPWKLHNQYCHISRTIQWIIKQFPHLKIGSRKVIDRGSAPIWHPGFYLKSADNQGNCCQWIQKEISQNGHRGNLRSILSSDYHECNMWLSRNGLVSVEFL